MTKVISIIQNKGGVGKSTVASNLACTLASAYPKKNILIIDLDAQGNQSLSFGYQPNSIKKTIYDVLMDEIKAEEAIIELKGNLHLLASNDDMNYFELDTLHGVRDLPDYFCTLKRALDKTKDSYDYIFVDSPPELKIIYAMIMMFTDEIYIPFEPDIYNAEGLMQLIKKIKLYKKEYKVNPDIKGVIPVKVRNTTILHRNVLEQVKEFCDQQNIRVMSTHIPHSIKYAEYIATAKKPIVWADPEGKHSLIYWNLLTEVIRNGEKNKRNRGKTNV